MYPLNACSLALMSPRVISCRVSSVRACLGEDARLGELFELRGALDAAALDVACRETGGHDNPADRHQDDDRCNDEPDVELSVGAPKQDHGARNDRDDGDAEQQEADGRKRADSALRLIDSGEVGGEDLRRVREQRGLHQRRRFPQVRRSDGKPLPVVRAVRPRPDPYRWPVGPISPPAPGGSPYRETRRSRRPAPTPLPPTPADIAPASGASGCRP